MLATRRTGRGGCYWHGSTWDGRCDHCRTIRWDRWMTVVGNVLSVLAIALLAFVTGCVLAALHGALV